MASLTYLQQLLNRLPQSIAHLRSRTSQNGVIIDGIDSLKETISVLRDVDAFREEMNFLTNSPLYQTTSDSLVVQEKSLADKIIRDADFVRYSIIALRRLMPRLLPIEPDNCVYFRFPDAEDVRSITGELSDINHANSSKPASADNFELYSGNLARCGYMS